MNEEKLCLRCDTIKPFSDFSRCAARKDGMKCYCRVCNSRLASGWVKENRDRFNAGAKGRYWKNVEINRAKNRAYNRARYHLVKDKINAQCRAYRLNNLEKERERCRAWREKNKAFVKMRAKEYNKRDALKIRERSRRRHLVDKHYAMRKALSARLSAALSGVAAKSKRTMELLGCTIEYLKIHLESQFKDGMTWDNYGRRGDRSWEIDHRRPCVSFDLSDVAQQEQCFHYTNLQPLWWYENLSKGSKWSKDGELVYR